MEDDQALREGIVMTLESPDVEMIQAETIAQGREAISRKMPDLILLDVNLPDGNGFDFCVEVRRESNVPVIFLTANDMELDIVRGWRWEAMIISQNHSDLWYCGPGSALCCAAEAMRKKEKAAFSTAAA